MHHSLLYMILDDILLLIWILVIILALHFEELFNEVL